ncbi:MAG: AAA family ATPase [Chitinispirillaceae bacterium]
MILLPYPCLVLLVGPAASGKSTFARKHFLKTEILSSDEFRAAVCDDEKDQSASGDAFELLHLIASKRLNRKRLTVIDATNVQHSSRQAILDLNRNILPTIAILFNFDEDDLMRQDLSRARRVGHSVIKMHLEQMKESLDFIRDEGYRMILSFSSPAQADSAKIRVLR